MKTKEITMTIDVLIRTLDCYKRCNVKQELVDTLVQKINELVDLL